MLELCTCRLPLTTKSSQGSFGVAIIRQRRHPLLTVDKGANSPSLYRLVFAQDTVRRDFCGFFDVRFRVLKSCGAEAGHVTKFWSPRTTDDWLCPTLYITQIHLPPLYKVICIARDDNGRAFAHVPRMKFGGAHTFGEAFLKMVKRCLWLRVRTPENCLPRNQRFLTHCLVSNFVNTQSG